MDYYPNENDESYNLTAVHISQTELPIEMPKMWTRDDPLHYAPAHPGDPWHNCRKMLSKYDKVTCDSWTDDISNMLTFTGLFTAVVTTFIVESYKWLQEDPEEFVPTRNAVQINALWFLSVSLSLAAALVGIMCKQWIHEYQRDVSVSGQDAVAIRQMRYAGFVAWRIPEIIASLPIMVQFSVFFFFAGMIELLCDLHPAVAIPSGIVVVTVALFALLSTILPSVSHGPLCSSEPRPTQYPCPYKSAQSWIFYRSIFLPTRNLLVSIKPFLVTSRLLNKYAHRMMGYLARVKTSVILKLSRSKAAPRKAVVHQSWIATEYQALTVHENLRLELLRSAILWVRDSVWYTIDTRFTILRCLMSLPSDFQIRWTLGVDDEYPPAPVYLLYHELLGNMAEPMLRAELLIRTVNDPDSDKYRPQGSFIVAAYSDEFKSGTAYALHMLQGLLFSIRYNRDILFQFMLSLQTLFLRCPGPSLGDHLKQTNIVSIMFALLECPFEDVQYAAGQSLTRPLLCFYFHHANSNDRGWFLFHVAEGLGVLRGVVRPGVTRASYLFVVRIDEQIGRVDAAPGEGISHSAKVPFPMSRYNWNTVRVAVLRGDVRNLSSEERAAIRRRLEKSNPKHHPGDGGVSTT